jgi:hypothetical protein
VAGYVREVGISGGLSLVRGISDDCCQSIWNLWWTERHWDRRASERCGSVLPTFISPILHTQYHQACVGRSQAPVLRDI